MTTSRKKQPIVTANAEGGKHPLLHFEHQQYQESASISLPNYSINICPGHRIRIKSSHCQSNGYMDVALVYRPTALLGCPKLVNGS